jgi:glycosyltransferase involved in cell wall biosynthesis
VKVVVVASLARSLLNFRGPLLASLRSAGHEVVACASGADAATVDSLEALGVMYHELRLERRGSDPLGDIRYWLALRRLFRAERPDLILAYTMKPVVYAGLASGRNRPPARYSLITGLGYGFGGGSARQTWTRAVLRPLLRAALRRSDGVIFQNEDDHRLFVDLGLVGGARTLVVRGSGVDLARFPAVPAATGPPRFLLLARMIRAKGVALFMEAARAIRDVHQEARFVMAGGVESGPDAVPLVELQAWHAAGLVEYLGRLEDVRGELARCTACVLPSYYREGTPRSLLEAMSTGRALVTTDTPGCRDTVFDAGPPDGDGVRQGLNGMLIPPRSIAPLVAALRRLVEVPGLAAALGRAGRPAAEAHYDVRLVDQRIIEFMGIARAT